MWHLYFEMRFQNCIVLIIHQKQLTNNVDPCILLFSLYIIGEHGGGDIIIFMLSTPYHTCTKI